MTHRIEVLYEDNHILALNKPCGLLTQPSRFSGDSLEDRAKAMIKESRGKPGNVFLHAVHRLDRVTSGIALFSLTGKSLSRMNEQMRRNEVTRIYHAVITGDLPAEQGVLEHFLRHSHLRSVTAGANDPGAKKALLRYRSLARQGRLVLVEVTLETGRYHQIRAQLSAAGCPVVGDSLYGSAAAYVEGGVALHHRRMEFVHPVRRDRVIVEADYPAEWPVYPDSESLS
ncbi:MAG TPA: RluA family pseudouridine synthase [Deltaproteobacteria bacterium]|jgi:23S rRNA pseudouridine1911/1915/1917 synthase|nr:RluA family pseudouridine synthase [Deltaproteobacteria bacterium]MDI9541535.1 RluA family pseudouridine synthase [Pseudomonadota bacterium]NLW66170.1 RluA family pseudouridine synthase [Bacteriovoracaceae bacterium]HRR22684.1 RluA family pseudouridine synthase [Desulfomonilia bacterium]HNR51375.1 RluA family pseudouridine synthase [Deltaproteobacteria bacterium]